LFIVVNLNANYIHWIGTYNKARQIAIKEQKRLFVLAIESNCSSCKRIVYELMQEKEIAIKINKKFVPVIVNFSHKVDYPIELLYTTVFPTIFLLDPKNELFIQKPIVGLDSIRATFYSP
jgi:thioredoxin-related protein